MGKYDIFFFDLDGTIIDSSVGITNSVKYTLRKYGIEETDREKLYPSYNHRECETFSVK